MGVTSEIFRLKVALMGCKPVVWREVEVAPSMTLAALHDVLQVLMGSDAFDLKAVNKALSALRAPRRPH